MRKKTKNKKHYQETEREQITKENERNEKNKKKKKEKEKQRKTKKTSFHQTDESQGANSPHVPNQSDFHFPSLFLPASLSLSLSLSFPLSLTLPLFVLSPKLDCVSRSTFSLSLFLTQITSPLSPHSYTNRSYVQSWTKKR